MWLAKYFQLSMFTKVLFCALIRPILEYGYVVLDFHIANDSRQLKRVRRKLLRFASYILKIACQSHDYTPVADRLGLSSLDEWRRTAGMKFINRLSNGKIESTVLVSLLCFKVHQRVP